MIDTVILSIPVNQVQILDYDKFTPSARGFMEPPYYSMGAKGHFNCVLNPDKHTNNGYQPRLTLSKQKRSGGYSIALKVELSIPKLIFANNFDEMSEQDFYTVIEMLHYQLATMGILTDYSTLMNCPVTGIHYGKNIVLENKATCALVIKIINQLRITKRWDIGNTDFRNEGQAIRFHTNHCELTFYDKVKDLEQARVSEHRAIETDNAIQFDLFNQLKPMTQVLRMECRLNNRKYIRTTLRDCGFSPGDLTLKELFNKDIAQTVLLHFWNKFIKPSLDVAVCANESQTALFGLFSSMGLKDSEKLKYCGALAYIKENGLRGLKQVLSPSNRIYKQLEKVLKQIDLQGNYLYNVFKFIEQELVAFTVVKLSNYPELQRI